MAATSTYIALSRATVRLAAGVGRRLAGQRIGQHGSLLPRRSHQPVDLPAVLHALAEREDVRVVSDEPVVHEDAALDSDPGPGRQRDLRAHPHASTTGSPSTCRPSARPTPVTARLPVTLLANDPEVYADTERLHRPAQHRTAEGVELHVHQVAHAVDDVDGQPVLQQAARRLQA